MAIFVPRYSWPSGKGDRLEICWDFPAQVEILPTTKLCVHLPAELPFYPLVIAIQVSNFHCAELVCTLNRDLFIYYLFKNILQR